MCMYVCASACLGYWVCAQVHTHVQMAETTSDVKQFTNLLSWNSPGGLAGRPESPSCLSTSKTANTEITVLRLQTHTIYLCGSWELNSGVCKYHLPGPQEGESFSLPILQAFQLPGIGAEYFTNLPGYC